MRIEVTRDDEHVGEVLFNEDTGAVTADMLDPNDQAQVEGAIAAANPSQTVGLVTSGGTKTGHVDWTSLEREIIHRLETFGFTCTRADG